MTAEYLEQMAAEISGELARARLALTTAEEEHRAAMAELDSSAEFDEKVTVRLERANAVLADARLRVADLASELDELRRSGERLEVEDPAPNGARHDH